MIEIVMFYLSLVLKNLRCLLNIRFSMMSMSEYSK